MREKRILEDVVDKAGDLPLQYRHIPTITSKMIQPIIENNGNKNVLFYVQTI
jgi:hypothetical protein